jgi:hypothetical protein
MVEPSKGRRVVELLAAAQRVVQRAFEYPGIGGAGQTSTPAAPLEPPPPPAQETERPPSPGYPPPRQIFTNPFLCPHGVSFAHGDDWRARRSSRCGRCK